MSSYYDTRTPMCKSCRRLRPCQPDGPTPNRLMFIGEGPGPVEDARRLPFIGPAGKELDGLYLPLAGLSRPDIYITNAIKCRQGAKNGDEPYPEEVHTCALHHLPGELAKCQPRLIVTLGATALHLFGDYSLEMHHGRPLHSQTFAQWSGTVFPIYHPAAGMRKSEYMIDLMDDFRALKLYLKGKLTVPQDEYPSPVYRCLNSLDDFTSVLNSTPDAWEGPGSLECAVDTETDAGRFWCLTYSMAPGTGYMIRADNTQLLRVFRNWLQSRRPMILFHNYLFDSPVLREVDIHPDRWIDTMQEAYQTNRLPKALKVLAYRLCGMHMQEYEDLVYPYALSSAIGYLDLVSKTRDTEWGREIVAGLPYKAKKLKCSGVKKYGGKHESTEVVITEPGVTPCPVCGNPKNSGELERDKGGRNFPWDVAAKILDKTMDKGANPVKEWAKVGDENRWGVEELVGRMEVPSINQVPFEEAVVYACRDADATIRVRPKIRAEAARLGRMGRGVR